MTHAFRQSATAPLWGAVLAAVACSSGDGTPSEPRAEPNAVTLGDNFFDPKDISVAVGDTITWTWGGSNPHNVTFDAGGPNSTVKTSGTFQRAFPAAGQFSYICTVHGRDIMAGTVTVQ